MQYPSPIETLATPDWASHLIRIQIKRDDLIHPVISGNKARKLNRLIEKIATEPPKNLSSMGGNRSNFLHALGYLCQQHNIQLTAYIRGHQPPLYGKTLKDLQRWGTQLCFVSKMEYKTLREKQPTDEWIPEGGSNADALYGVMKAVDELEQEPDTIFVPVGTGCTALGLALGIKQRHWKTQVIGIVVLKGVEGKTQLQQDIFHLAKQAGYALPDNLHLKHGFCDKGFGKQSEKLKQQKTYFEQIWNVPLDPVYTVKMCNAFKHYTETAHPNLGQQVLLWHTGGLQGNQ